MLIEDYEIVRLRSHDQESAPSLLSIKTCEFENWLTPTIWPSSWHTEKVNSNGFKIQ